MNTKEQIKAAAAKRFKTKEVDLGEGVKVTLRELSTTEHKALRARLFVCDAQGEPVAKENQYEYREGVHATEEWLAATMVPEHTVDDLLDPAWPESLKGDLYREALRLNGITVKDAAGN